MKAVLRRIRISPKKANLVAGIVREKKVNEALELLEHMPKKAAKILYKVINSAAHNAKHKFDQSINDLFITEILVTKGPTYKRSVPISRGRAQPIRKRTSHITITVGMPIKEGVKKEEKTKEAKVEKVEKKPKKEEPKEKNK